MIVWFDPWAHLLWLSDALPAILCGLGSCCLLVSEYAHHVWTVAREIAPTQLAWGQQEHDAFVEEGDAHSLLAIKVVYVLLELLLVCIALGHKRDDSVKIIIKSRDFNIFQNLPLTFDFVDVFEVGAQRNV